MINPIPGDQFISIILFCESWPTWVKILTKSLGFHCEAIFSPNPDLFLTWNTTNPTLSWHSMSELAAILANYPSVTHFAIAGTRSYLDVNIRFLPLNSIFLAYLNLNLVPLDIHHLPPWTWIQLSHSSCGGVTTGCYWCGTTLFVESSKKEIDSSQHTAFPTPTDERAPTSPQRLPVRLQFT